MSGIHNQALKLWMAKGCYFSFNGHNIFTIDEGDKKLPVIILIHGFPTSSIDYSGVWVSLRKNYRLVTIDMLGFGFSDKPNNRNYTIHKQADLFDELISHLQIKKFHLLAHDYGDSVAQELLARQLERSASARCLSCCFLNGGLFPETHRALLFQKLMLSPFGFIFNKLLSFKAFKQTFRKVFGESSHPNEQEFIDYWEVINFNNGKHLFHNLITYMDDRIAHRERWLHALQKAKVPLALINGSVDPISGSHLVDRYKELNCRLDYLEQLDGIGHYPQQEAPASVSNHYSKFLELVTQKTT